MLLGQVPRADRLAIVRDVESQIHDLLAARNPDDTDRDAVIAALVRLDPPEAYLPDEAGAASRPPLAPAQAARARPRLTPSHPAARSNLVAAKASGILGIVSLILIGLMAAALVLGQLGAFGRGGNGFAELLVLGLLVAATPTGLLAIIFAATSRLPNSWAVAGLVAGIIGFMSCSGIIGYVVLGTLF